MYRFDSQARYEFFSAVIHAPVRQQRTCRGFDPLGRAGRKDQFVFLSFRVSLLLSPCLSFPAFLRFRTVPRQGPFSCKSPLNHVHRPRVCLPQLYPTVRNVPVLLQTSCPQLATHRMPQRPPLPPLLPSSNPSPSAPTKHCAMRALPRRSHLPQVPRAIDYPSDWVRQLGSSTTAPTTIIRRTSLPAGLCSTEPPAFIPHRTFSPVLGFCPVLRICIPQSSLSTDDEPWCPDLLPQTCTLLSLPP